MSAVLPTYPFRGLSFVRGEGSNLFDTSGRKYLDCITNYGVSIFGYNHPEIVGLLQEQFAALPTLHGSFGSPVREQAARQLVRRCGGRVTQVYFSNSGTEAVEAALKFAVLATGRHRIIAMQRGYHGKTFGSLSVTPNEKYRAGLAPLLWETVFVPFGDVSALQAAVNQNTAAVIVEPVQGEGGIFTAPSKYFATVRRLCDKTGALFIADEIQSGLGRTGTFLALQQEGTEADIVCLGKGLAGGVPCGATLVSTAVASALKKGSQTSTFGGNPLACRGITATLDLTTETTLRTIQTLGEYFLKLLKKIGHDRIVAVRGRGLMIGVEVRGDRNQVLKNMQMLGVLACPASEQVVRFLPPYCISKTEINQAVEALEKSL